MQREAEDAEEAASLASGEAQKVWIQPPWSRVAWMAGRRGADAQIGAVLRQGVRAARGLLPPASLHPQRWRQQNQLGKYQENDNSKKRIAATINAAAARGIRSASVLSSRFQRTWWNVVGRSKRAVPRRLVLTEHRGSCDRGGRDGDDRHGQVPVRGRSARCRTDLGAAEKPGHPPIGPTVGSPPLSSAPSKHL